MTGTLEICTIPRPPSRIALITPCSTFEKVCAAAASPAIDLRDELDSNYFCCKHRAMQGEWAASRPRTIPAEFPPESCLKGKKRAQALSLACVGDQEPPDMQIGVIGLGRMGANIVRRLQRGKHECVAYDADASVVGRLAAEGLRAIGSLADFIKQLAAPRGVWVMGPAGAPTEETIARRGERLARHGGHLGRAWLDFGLGRDHRGLAPRQRGFVLAARPPGGGAPRERNAVEFFRRGRGFRRGSLDGECRDRGGRPGRGAHRRALCALPLAPGAHLCGARALRHAVQVRRPRRAVPQAVTVAVHSTSEELARATAAWLRERATAARPRFAVCLAGG